MPGKTETQIRRRPDGSIDTAHYMARGRRMRAEAARDLAGVEPDARRRWSVPGWWIIG